MPDALTQAIEAHRKALAAQQVMQETVDARNAAVRAARDAGHSAPEIAAALNVNRQRVYQMLNKEKP